MKTSIDSRGRIELGVGIQQQLGIRPGDEVILEVNEETCVIRPCRRSGLGMEGNVLVHHGSMTSPADTALVELRDQRVAQFVEGLPR